MKKGEMLSRAIHIATNAHFGQFDKGGKPYILHPLKVMSLLPEDADEEMRCVAVLHDSVEDNKDITYSFLRENEMSERVINAVRCLTKIRWETYEEYQEKVLSNYDSMQVKKADLTHNSDIRRLKGVTEKDVARMVEYHKFFLLIEKTLSERGKNG